MVKYFLPSTTTRVSDNTNRTINSKIRTQTIKCLNTYKNSSYEVLTNEIKRLNHEWDIERVLETNASVIILLSGILGIKHSRKWFVLTGAVAGFLLQHAITGWCPPVPVLRKIGIRTQNEIYNEKMVLKVLRNDMLKINPDSNMEDILGSIEKQ